MTPDSINRINPSLVNSSSPRFGSLSVKSLAQAVLGRFVPQTPTHDQLVFHTLDGTEVQVFMPITSGKAANQSAKTASKLNLTA